VCFLSGHSHSPSNSVLWRAATIKSRLGLLVK
jgi:hypothetical protein